MLNMNNAAVLNLPKLADGTRITLTGEELFNTREVHMVPTAKSITITADTNVHILGTGEYINTSPIYEQSIETDGSLDGGLAVNILTDAEAGSFNAGTTTIGGTPTNIAIILDGNGDELLLPNGDQVFGIVGIKGSVIGTSRLPVNHSIQLSFAVKNGGVITAVTIAAGTYSYHMPTVYSWATARWRELKIGGTSTGMGGSDSASQTEIIGIMNANLSKPAYVNYKLSADSNKDKLVGYKAVFTLTKDGSTAPSFKITSNDSTTVYTSVGTLTTEGVGIIAAAGTGAMSDITFTINGNVVDPQYVDVVVAGNIVTVTLDNSGNDVTRGIIYNTDTYGIVYTKPAGI